MSSEAVRKRVTTATIILPPASSSSAPNNSKENESTFAHRKPANHWKTSTLRFIVMISCLLVIFGGIIIHNNSKNMLHDENGSSTTETTMSTKSSLLPPPPPNFVTIVDSGSEVNPKARLDRIKAIQDTWGPAARAIYVVNANATDDPVHGHFLSSDDNNSTTMSSHPPPLDVIVLPKGVPDRSIAALQHVIRYLVQTDGQQQQQHDKTYSTPDYVLFTNGHTYVIPENLCNFIVTQQQEEQQQTTPAANDYNNNTRHPFLYAGHALQRPNSGLTAFQPQSSGYILSLPTMQHLVQQWDRHEQLCFKDKHPGRFLSNCLEWTLNVTALDTRDKIYKRHMFHAFPLMALTRRQDAVSSKSFSWYDELSQHPNQYGAECCAANSITFHYIEAVETRAMYEAIMMLKKKQSQQNDMTTMTTINNNTTLYLDDDAAFQSYLQSIWPSKVGGYSKPLPGIKDLESWKNLMTVLRRIAAPAPSNPHSLSCTTEALLRAERGGGGVSRRR